MKLRSRLIITYESLEDTKRYGLEGRDSDALYQLLLSSQGVEAAVFLRQDTPSTCSGGFRSQDKIDVSIVAPEVILAIKVVPSGFSIEQFVPTFSRLKSFIAVSGIQLFFVSFKATCHT